MSLRERAESHFHLAVLGASDPMGESFLRLLEEREIAVGELHALSLGESDDSVSFHGVGVPCVAAESFDFSAVQMLVLVTAHAAARRVAEQVHADFPHMPVLGLDSVEAAPVIVASRVLKVVDALAGVAHVESFVTLPAALAGKPGIEELADQSRALFNLESPEAEVFPLQIAFNLQPVMQGSDPRYSPVALSAALSGWLGTSKGAGFSVVWAPVFYGAAMALHVNLEKSADLDQLRAALRHQDDILLMESDLPAASPSPATDAADSEAVFIGNIRLEAEDVRFWMVFDPLRIESAQLVAGVENWIARPASSMLT